MTLSDARFAVSLALVGPWSVWAFAAPPKPPASSASFPEAERVDSAKPASTTVEPAPSVPEAGDEKGTPGVAPSPSSWTEEWEELTAEESQLAPRRSPEPVMAGFGVGFGFASSGESLVTATLSDGALQELEAGAGIVLTARGFFNPLRPICLGLGVAWGFKHSAIGASNAGVSLRRFPFELMGRFLARFMEGSFIPFEAAPGSRCDARD